MLYLDVLFLIIPFRCIKIHTHTHTHTTTFIATIFKITILVGIFVFWREAFLNWEYLETMKNDDEYRKF